MRRQVLSSLISGLAVTAVLAACSGNVTRPEPSQTPACSQVWVEGDTLPADYEGCMDGESLVVAISDNTGAVVYDDRLAAKPGQSIAKVGEHQ